MQHLQELGSIIRAKRGRMTAAELGQKIGRSQSYVSALENATVAKGQTRPIIPPDDMLLAIAQALEVPVVELHRALGRIEEDADAMPIEYAPILDELRSASYDGGLDSGDVDEISEIIRMKHRRKAERQGRA